VGTPNDIVAQAAIIQGNTYNVVATNFFSTASTVRAEAVCAVGATTGTVAAQARSSSSEDLVGTLRAQLEAQKLASRH